MSEKKQTIETSFVMSKIAAKFKMVEVKEDGAIVDRIPTTEVTMTYEGTPGELDELIMAMAAGQTIEANLFCRQLPLRVNYKESVVTEDGIIADKSTGEVLVS